MLAMSYSATRSNLRWRNVCRLFGQGTVDWRRVCCLTRWDSMPPSLPPLAVMYTRATENQMRLLAGLGCQLFAFGF
ncbi:unnamed protein product [Pieris brassicae]|uniref:Uncharacterized protein n=1 Tax=Pieris brassicae TaxID=7116 RepID=A0A9P0T0Q1_PIEBR|nr:unnamed protein product [Pieris brassicae]